MDIHDYSPIPWYLRARPASVRGWWILSPGTEARRSRPNDCDVPGWSRPWFVHHVLQVSKSASVRVPTFDAGEMNAVMESSASYTKLDHLRADTFRRMKRASRAQK